jgi:hypothetical protein
MPEAAVLDRSPDAVAVRSERTTSACMAKLNRLDWAVCDWYEVEGYRFGVRTTSPAFAEWARYALSAYAADGPPAVEVDPLLSIVVAEDMPREAGSRKLHILYLGTMDVVRSFDLAAVARSFLSEVEAVTFPARDDAVYLEASVIRGGQITALIPTWMVPSINVAGRRIRRRLDVDLPCHLSVAIDASTGHLIAVRETLARPTDSIDVLVGWSRSPAADRRAFVDRELAIDRVVVFPSGPSPIGVHRISRGPVVYDLAQAIRNLSRVGGRGLEAVGRALGAAEVLQVQWANTQQLIDVVAEVLRRDGHAADRTSATSGER